MGLPGNVKSLEMYDLFIEGTIDEDHRKKL